MTSPSVTELTRRGLHAVGSGPIYWDLNIGDDAHRTYTVRYKIWSEDPDNGPAVIANATGLPLVGAPWSYGNDIDWDATCSPYTKVTPYEQDHDRHHFWIVELKFTTKPLKRCYERREDPLLEPPKVMGSSMRATREAKRDKDGDPIQSSSFEFIHGPQVEFDDNRPSLSIQHNTDILDLDIISSLCNTVNGVNLWGLSRRCIKLSHVSWEALYYGDAYCNTYYSRTFEFETNQNTFDRSDIMDEGTKALGKWNPNADPPTWVVPAGFNKNNMRDFNRYRDRSGEVAHCLLNGLGEPLADDADPTTIPNTPTQYYPDTYKGVAINYMALLRLWGLTHF